MTNEETWRRPSLWRVVIFALVIALVGNVFLYGVSRDDDWFANLISVASGITAVALLAGWFRFREILDETLLAVFVIWTANVIEFALESGPSWESHVRQCAMYASQALLALGAYVARRAPKVVDNG